MERMGGTQRVSNIQLQDKEGTKVRMTLWNKDLDRFPELESNLVCAFPLCHFAFVFTF
jgi:hypothetical protein